MFSLFLSINSSISEQTESICNEIEISDGRVQTLILAGSPISYSAIRAGLQYQHTQFNDITAEDCISEIDKFWRKILEDWAHWQVARDVNSFVQFSNDLSILNFLSNSQVSELNEVLSKLSKNYLTNQYDVLFSQFPEKFKKIISQFDFGKNDLNIEMFLKKYERVWGKWGKIGNCHILAVKNLLAPYDQKEKYSLKVLLKNLSHFLSNERNESRTDTNPTTLALMSKMSFNKKNEIEGQIFYTWSEQVPLNKSKKIFPYLAKKNTFNVLCLENDRDVCLQQLTDIFDTQPILKSSSSRAEIFSENLINISQTKVAYDSRRNINEAFDNYSYTLDSKTAYQCKLIESLLRNPGDVFYKNILIPKIWDEFNIKKIKKIFIGTIVHEFLNISPNGCCEVPRIEDFDTKIAKKFNEILSKKRDVLGENFNQYVLESMYSAQFIARKLAKQIISYGHKYISTEVILPQNSEIKFGEHFVKLNGRIDCILSNERFSIERPNDKVTLNIFDFKTGTYESLISNKLPKQLEDYVGVQVLLYGLILRKLGFCNINVQFLSPDKTAMNPVNIDDMLFHCGWLFNKLGNIFDTGIIGDNIRTFVNRSAVYDDNPISESSVENKIIALKKQISC